MIEYEEIGFNNTAVSQLNYTLYYKFNISYYFAYFINP